MNNNNSNINLLTNFAQGARNFFVFIIIFFVFWMVLFSFLTYNDRLKKKLNGMLDQKCFPNSNIFSLNMNKEKDLDLNIVEIPIHSHTPGTVVRYPSSGDIPSFDISEIENDQIICRNDKIEVCSGVGCNEKSNENSKIIFVKKKNYLIFSFVGPIDNKPVLNCKYLWRTLKNK